MGSRHPVNKLTALEVARLKIPGRYADGNNLYLLVEPSGAKRWVLRLTVNGRRRDMGFGNSIVIPLKKAKEMAIYYKSLAKSGLDPILERKKEQGLNEEAIELLLKVLNLNPEHKDANDEASH